MGLCLGSLPGAISFREEHLYVIGKDSEAIPSLLRDCCTTLRNELEHKRFSY